MPKYGMKFDYDLMANREVKEGDKCIICEKDLVCRWADRHGEGVCLTCGMAYQLMHGSEEQEKENNYPYPNVEEEWILIFKEYWDETQKFVFAGMSMSEKTGLDEFYKWAHEKHPELFDVKEK